MFKKGDIIELIRNPGDMVAQIGAEAEFIRYDGEFITIKWLNKKACGQSDGGYYPDHFMKKIKIHELRILNEKKIMKLANEVSGEDVGKNSNYSISWLNHLILLNKDIWED